MTHKKTVLLAERRELASKLLYHEGQIANHTKAATKIQKRIAEINEKLGESGK